MARIAEETLLLLLDNASAQPGLEYKRSERVVAAAVLLDLAYAFRPAVAGEAAPEGRLMLLAGPDPQDHMLLPALRLLGRRPPTPHAAVTRLSRDTLPMVLTHLARTGQVRPMITRRKRFKKKRSWPLTDRTRVKATRSAVMSVLFDGRVPEPSTAAIISLLHAADGLGALLSLTDRGWHGVSNRAGDIAGGSWVDAGAQLPEVNLAVTTSAVAGALP